jgi:AAA domain
MATPLPRPINQPPTKQQPPTPVRQRASKLAGIQRGRLKTPLRYLFYSTEGIGKSTLAADSPNPLFLDIEGGSPELIVSRYPFRDEPGGHVPRTYQDVLDAISDLIDSPSHGYETLVVDTADALESLIHIHVSKVNGKKDVEAFGYGKGYKVASAEMRTFLSRLEVVQAKGMAIIVLAHSMVRTFKNPDGPDYDRHQLCTHELVGAQLKAWSDVVGYLRYDGGAAVLPGDASQAPRARGWSTGRRMIHLSREAAWDAKCRLSMPAAIELGVASPWAPFAAAKDAARDSTVESLIADVLIEIDRITVGDRDAEFCTAAGTATSFAAINQIIARSDAGSLTRVLAGLRATQSIAAIEES